MFQILEGFIKEGKILLLSGGVLLCGWYVLHTLHKTRSFTSVALMVVLVGFVLFFLNDPGYVQGQVCQAFSTAASAVGAAGPTC